MQKKTDREKFSRLRQTLLHLACEIKGLVEPLFSNRPVIKGTVYELRRRCGKPGCKCARGDLHRSMMVSASEGGKTRLRVIPDGFLVEVQVKVRRCQELRRVRARLGEIHRQMLRVMDEMEGMRREDLSRMYDSLLGISGALYLSVFEQPARRVLFSILLKS